MYVYRYIQKHLHRREIKKSAELMKRLDKEAIPSHLNEIRLFMVVRNEELRIPYIVKRYRAMGVDRFFIVDNNSTDGTIEQISGQDDIHVFHTKESYKIHWNWMEWLLENFGRNRWCVVIDADELFVYPHYEVHNLKSLCAYLDQCRQTAMNCVLLDMYSEGETGNINYRSGDDFLKACSFFDPWSFRKKTIRHRNRKTFRTYPFEAFYGGMRNRVFGIDNCATKIPLVKYGESVFLHPGMHSVDGAMLSELQGAVLHFKYLQDFGGRVREEVEREIHYKKATEYKAYLKKLESEERTIFHNQDSIRYENSAQLQRLGFVKSSPEFETFLESRRENKP